MRRTGQRLAVLVRFIPTYVGHTPQHVGQVAHQAVHPHLRGAYGDVGIPITTDDGSSPHTWGIPSWPRRCRQTDAVHPHMRGAYRQENVSFVRFFGSSPHTWGIREAAMAARIQQRFIPTYVGHTPRKRGPAQGVAVHPHTHGAYRGVYYQQFPTYVGHTCERCQPHLCTAVHPHICGAYGCEKVLLLRTSGSSPPTWGIPVHRE